LKRKKRTAKKGGGVDGGTTNRGKRDHKKKKKEKIRTGASQRFSKRRRMAPWGKSPKKVSRENSRGITIKIVITRREGKNWRGGGGFKRLGGQWC